MDSDHNIKRYGHTFVYEPDEAHTPRYFIRDGSDPVVIILHEGPSHAFLNTRAFGTNEWTPHPSPLYLEEALEKGAEHADRYYEQARDQTDRPQSDTERRAWEKIREARQRRENEKNRDRDRDDGRER